MNDPQVERRVALDQARAFERAGDVEGAKNAYLRAEEVDEATRVLVAARRFSEAGQVLLGALRVDPKQVGALDPDRRKRALRAAICFANGGQTRVAVDLLVNLGERDKAIELLERAGDQTGAALLRAQGGAPRGTSNGLPAAGRAPAAAANGALAAAMALESDGKLDLALDAFLKMRQFGHAGRVAHRLRRLDRAADYFAQAGMPYEAAVCFRELGDAARCLEFLVRVPREDRRYRQAAAHAVKLAIDLGRFDFALDNFLGAFLRAGPQDDREVEVFYQFADHAAKHDAPESARDALEKILERSPRYRDVPERLGAIQREGRRSTGTFEQITNEQEAFRQGIAKAQQAPNPTRSGAGRAHLGVDLPDLPDLPQSPTTPGFAPATQGIGLASPFGPPSPAPAAAGSYAGSYAGSLAGSLAGSSPGAPAPTPGGPARTDTLAVSGAGPIAAPPSPPAPPPPPPASVQAGSLTEGITVSSRYRLEKKIGQGGMAAVFKAVDLELEETIAIKFFAAHGQDEQMLVRFKSEVTLSRQLNHPNIIRLYDIGTFGDYKFITMELLQGSDLNKLLGEGPVEFATAIDFLVQACAGLQVVHDRGVIHRDIKPDNFFITTEGNLKVMDFGIAKRKAHKAVTVAGMMAGTPEYMAPEQINDFSSVTHLADLYALGCIAYRMFTGSVPFSHPELMPLLVMHVADKPEPPRKRNPKIPPALEAMILQLLEKKPSKRIQSCRELADKLQEIRRELPGEAGRRG